MAGWACHDIVGCIVTREKAEGLAGRGHDTINCIVTWKGLAAGKIWLRYKDCIVTRRGLGSWALCRDLGHDTAQGCAIRPRQGRLCPCDMAARPATWPAVGHDMAPLRLRARGLGSACAHRLGCVCTLCT